MHRATGAPSTPPSRASWWQTLRARRSGELAGVDLERYPRDFAALARYDEALQKLPSRVLLPPPLSLADLDDWLADAGEHPGVRWEDLP